MDLEAVRGEIVALADEIESAFRLAAEGLARFQRESIERALEKVASSGAAAERLTQTVVELAGGRPPGGQADLRVVQRLKLLGDCIEDFARAALAKLGEGLIFSDRAFRELEGLHAAAGALLSRAVAAYKAADAGLAGKVAEEGAAVEGMSDAAGAAHEKRLLSGTCDVRSSAVYLDMLDAIRRIAVHAAAMACACHGAP